MGGSVELSASVVDAGAESAQGFRACLFGGESARDEMVDAICNQCFELFVDLGVELLLVAWREPKEPANVGAQAETHRHALFAARIVTRASKWSTRRCDSVLRKVFPAGVSL